MQKIFQANKEAYISREASHIVGELRQSSIINGVDEEHGRLFEKKKKKKRECHWRLLLSDRAWTAGSKIPWMETRHENATIRRPANKQGLQNLSEVWSVFKRLKFRKKKQTKKKRKWKQGEGETEGKGEETKKRKRKQEEVVQKEED